MTPDQSALSRILGRLRFRHLHLIEVLARNGNMHRAAEEMSITQPAVTKLLQDVEDILDARLFTRSSRGMQPTEIGAAVAEAAGRLLSDAGKMARNVESLRDGGYGSIAVGVIMATATDLLPRVIFELKRRRPLLTIHLTAATSDVLLNALERNELDAVVGRFTQSRHEALFTIEPLANEELWAFTAAGNKADDGALPSLFELTKRSWVLQPAPSPMRQILDRLFARIGVEAIANVVETTSVFATLHLVRSAGMVAVLPRSIVEDSVGSGEFLHIPIAVDNPLADYGLILRKNVPASRNIEEFAEVLRDVVRALG